MTGVPKRGPVVAIDGPAGTGKSSATKRLAEALGFTHVDTGALYRSLAYVLAEHRGLKSGTPEWIEQAKKDAHEVHIEFRRDPSHTPANRVWVNGEDVTSQIRTPEMSMAASAVSAIPEVRAALLGLQRRLGCVGKTILEGRDIGTVIFPDADVKFFLTASIEERAKRRLAELEAMGAETPSFEELKKQIQIRDHDDSTRAVAPLKKAVDAIELDTSQMTLDEVVRLMESQVRERIR